MSIAEAEARTTVAPPRTKVRRRKGHDGMGTGPLRGLLPLVLLLVIWQVVGDPSSPYFPPPSKWVTEVRPLLDDGVLATAIGDTALTVVLGLLIATVLGAALGALVGANRTLDRAAGPTLEFLRVLPAAALVPLAALLLGYTLEMKLAVVILPATWPVLLTVRSARRAMSPVLLDVPRTLHLSWWARTRKILVPALTPSVLLGVRVSGPLALIIALLVEIVTKINGIGALLGTAQATFKSAQVFGLLVIAGLLGFAVNWLVTRAESAVNVRLTGGGR
ncbi:ABC transporter permease [Pseudonocardia kunmingensis]|uniref:ABC-type nitrate/sulfonate/bicarbonate transport system permease component n=1 Tax=Pseudonocardia kunmingensis TaxID=630975 RepID=A0A543DNX6_9PSEU|nr:ABC transporter permease subunit [Pseudonocardia kunmingensis]TQM11037.1 ABC-type nitrate/sulfonate/bicarbonate transport system permease component [Pseudonocardia kunmingensis]